MSEDSDFEIPVVIPAHLEELPVGTRLWLGSLTPEKITRLKQLDKLADDVDPVRIKELLELADKANTVRRFGQWMAVGLVTLVLLGGQIIDAVERIWVWVRHTGRAG